MATPLLGLALPSNGATNWGDTVNTSITSLVDSAVAGTTTLSADSDVTLTNTVEVNNQAREAIILWTATGTATRNITAPGTSKTYIVINSSATQSIVLKAAATTGVTILPKERCVVAWNGSDYTKVSMYTFVTPEQFGAKGDGSTNDTAALQAALDSGFNVFLSLGRTYKFVTSLKMTTDNQIMEGPGILSPDGSINGVVVGGEAPTNAGSFVIGKTYVITTAGNTSFTSIGAGNNNVGTTFVATGVGSGSGAAWITCFGNELSLTFSSATQTSSSATNGYAVFVGNGNRVKINKLLLNNAYGGLYVTKCNMISLEWMWGIIRGPGITWYGNASQRSDVFDINWCVLNHGYGQYGFNWDGNCHSLNVKELGLIGGENLIGAGAAGGGKGIIIQNTSGGTIPAIGRFEHLELDYINNSHGIAITTGLDFDITNPYINGTGLYNNGNYVGPTGAAFNGIYVGSTVQNEEVRVTGGKSNGNTGYGIRSDGGSVLYAGNTQLAYNTLGEVYGYLYNKAPYQLVDTYYYSYIGGNDPYTVYDSAARTAGAGNSYLQYVRSTKQLVWAIDSVATYKLTSAYNQSIIPMYIGNTGTNNATLRMYGSTSGYVGFTVPVAAGSTTYTFPAAPVNGNFLQTDSSGNLTWAPASGGGGGGVATVTATPPVFSTGGANPIISVNASSGVTASYLVQRDASGDFAGRIITADQYTVAANFFIAINAGDPVLVFDSNDYLSYDRTNNQYNFQIGGSGVLASNTTALQSFKPIRIQGSTSGYVGFAAQATAGTTTYTWPTAPVVDYFLKTDASGNLSWAAPAVAASALTGNTLSSSVTSSSLTGVGTIATGVWQGSAIADTYLGTISTASKVSNSATTATSANTASAIVARDASGNFSAGTITAAQYTVGANYYLTFSSGNPIQAWDASSYFSYDRTNNQLNAVILGNGVLGLTATAVQAYKPLQLWGSTSGYVGFAAQATAGSATYTWPTAPVNGNYLQTDASGNLTWAAGGGASAATPTALGTVYGRTPSTVDRNSTALGYQAGAIAAPTGGLYVTAIGYQAIQAGTGSYNTAVGFRALGSVTVGDQNTAVGYYAGEQFTDPGVGLAGGNTFIGYLCGAYVTTGQTNTFIGRGAGAATITGSGNTAIGSLALANSPDNTTNSTALGKDADVTGNNQIQLGSGSTTCYTNGAVQNRSDIRDKAEVRDTQLGLGFINALRPVDYKWDMREDYRPPVPEDISDQEAMAAWREASRLSGLTHDGSKKRTRFHHGLIAQEVKAVLDAQGIDFGGYQDHKVKGGEDVLSLGYEELIAPLIKAIQELTARVQELEAKA